MPTIVNLFVYSIISLSIIYIIGKLFYFIFNSEIHKKSNFYSKAFFELLTGIVIIVFLKSIIETSFQTINILFLLLVIEFIIFKIYKKERIVNLSFDTKNILEKEKIIKTLQLILFFILIFLIHSLYLYSFSNQSFKIPDEDLLFYSKVSNSISLYGKENFIFSYNNIINQNDNGIVLYHFFDLWTNSFFFQLFNISSYFSLFFITAPIFTFILFVGITSLWEKIGKLNFLKLILTILLLFVSGMYFDFYKIFRYMTNTIPLLTDTMPFTYYGRKLIPVAIFSVLTLNLFYEKYYHRGFIFLLFTTVVYTSGTMFGIFSSLSLIFLTYILFKKRINFITIQKKTIIFWAVFILCFILFTSINRLKGFSDGIIANSIFNFESTSDLIQNIKSALSVVFYYSLFFIFCYLLFLIPILLNLKVLKDFFIKIKIYIIYITIALVVGMFFLFLFFKDLNARQFFTNLLPFVNVNIIFAFIIFYEKTLVEKKIDIKKIFSLIIIICIFYVNIELTYTKQVGYQKINEKYSNQFLTDVSKQLEEHTKTVTIAYRLKQSEYSTFYSPLFTNWSFLDFYGYTNYVNNSKIIFSNYKNKFLYNNCELCDFIDNKKDTNNYQLNFLIEKNIKILVADTIQNNIPLEIIDKFYINKINNECIYFFK